MVQVAGDRWEQGSGIPLRHTGLGLGAGPGFATNSPCDTGQDFVPLWASACLSLEWDSVSSKADFDCDLPSR